MFRVVSIRSEDYPEHITRSTHDVTAAPFVTAVKDGYRIDLDTLEEGRTLLICNETREVMTKISFDNGAITILNNDERCIHIQAKKPIKKLHFDSAATCIFDDGIDVDFINLHAKRIESANGFKVNQAANILAETLTTNQQCYLGKETHITVNDWTLERGCKVQQSQFQKKSDVPKITVNNQLLLKKDASIDTTDIYWAVNKYRGYGDFVARAKNISLKPDAHIPEGLSFVSVPTDGNCLYHAVDLHFKEGVTSLRQKVAAHLRAHREKYSGFVSGDFEEYVTGVETDGVWGGQLELTVLHELFNCKIVVLHIDRTKPGFPMVIGECVECANEPIAVAYDGMHYNGFTIQVGYNAQEILTHARRADNEGEHYYYNWYRSSSERQVTIAEGRSTGNVTFDGCGVGIYNWRQNDGVLKLSNGADLIGQVGTALNVSKKASLELDTATLGIAGDMRVEGNLQTSKSTIKTVNLTLQGASLIGNETRIHVAKESAISGDFHSHNARWFVRELILDDNIESKSYEFNCSHVVAEHFSILGKTDINHSIFYIQTSDDDVRIDTVFSELNLHSSFVVSRNLLNIKGGKLKLSENMTTIFRGLFAYGKVEIDKDFVLIEKMARFYKDNLALTESELFVGNLVLGRMSLVCESAMDGTLFLKPDVSLSLTGSTLGAKEVALPNKVSVKAIKLPAVKKKPAEKRYASILARDSISYSDNAQVEGDTLLNQTTGSGGTISTRGDFSKLNTYDANTSYHYNSAKLVTTNNVHVRASRVFHNNLLSRFGAKNAVNIEAPLFLNLGDISGDSINTETLVAVNAQMRGNTVRHRPIVSGIRGIVTPRDPLSWSTWGLDSLHFYDEAGHFSPSWSGKGATKFAQQSATLARTSLELAALLGYAPAVTGWTAYGLSQLMWCEDLYSRWLSAHPLFEDFPFLENLPKESFLAILRIIRGETDIKKELEPLFKKMKKYSDSLEVPSIEQIKSWLDKKDIQDLVHLFFKVWDYITFFKKFLSENKTSLDERLDKEAKEREIQQQEQLAQLTAKEREKLQKENDAKKAEDIQKNHSVVEKVFTSVLKLICRKYSDSLSEEEIERIETIARALTKVVGTVQGSSYTEQGVFNVGIGATLSGRYTSTFLRNDSRATFVAAPTVNTWTSNWLGQLAAHGVYACAEATHEGYDSNDTFHAFADHVLFKSQGPIGGSKSPKGYRCGSIEYRNESDRGARGLGGDHLGFRKVFVKGGGLDWNGRARAMDTDLSERLRLLADSRIVSSMGQSHLKAADVEDAGTIDQAYLHRETTRGDWSQISGSFTTANCIENDIAGKHKTPEGTTSIARVSSNNHAALEITGGINELNGLKAHKGTIHQTAGSLTVKTEKESVVNAVVDSLDVEAGRFAMASDRMNQTTLDQLQGLKKTKDIPARLAANLGQAVAIIREEQWGSEKRETFLLRNKHIFGDQYDLIKDIICPKEPPRGGHRYRGRLEKMFNGRGIVLDPAAAIYKPAANPKVKPSESLSIAAGPNTNVSESSIEVWLKTNPGVDYHVTAGTITPPQNIRHDADVSLTSVNTPMIFNEVNVRSFAFTAPAEYFKGPAHANENGCVRVTSGNLKIGAPVTARQVTLLLDNPAASTILTPNGAVVADDDLYAVLAHVYVEGPVQFISQGVGEVHVTSLHAVPTVTYSQERRKLDASSKKWFGKAVKAVQNGIGCRETFSIPTAHGLIIGSTNPEANFAVYFEKGSDNVAVAATLLPGISFYGGSIRIVELDLTAKMQRSYFANMFNIGKHRDWSEIALSEIPGTATIVAGKDGTVELCVNTTPNSNYLSDKPSVLTLGAEENGRVTVRGKAKEEHLSEFRAEPTLLINGIDVLGKVTTLVNALQGKLNGAGEMSEIMLHSLLEDLCEKEPLLADARKVLLANTPKEQFLSVLNLGMDLINARDQLSNAPDCKSFCKKLVKRWGLDGLDLNPGFKTRYVEIVKQTPDDRTRLQQDIVTIKAPTLTLKDGAWLNPTELLNTQCSTIEGLALEMHQSYRSQGFDFDIGFKFGKGGVGIRFGVGYDYRSEHATTYQCARINAPIWNLHHTKVITGNLQIAVGQVIGRLDYLDLVSCVDVSDVKYRHFGGSYDCVSQTLGGDAHAGSGSSRKVNAGGRAFFNADDQSQLEVQRLNQAGASTNLTDEKVSDGVTKETIAESEDYREFGISDSMSVRKSQPEAKPSKLTLTTLTYNRQKMHGKFGGDEHREHNNLSEDLGLKIPRKIGSDKIPEQPAPIGVRSINSEASAEPAAGGILIGPQPNATADDVLRVEYDDSRVSDQFLWMGMSQEAIDKKYPGVQKADLYKRHWEKLWSKFQTGGREGLESFVDGTGALLRAVGLGTANLAKSTRVAALFIPKEELQVARTAVNSVLDPMASFVGDTIKMGLIPSAVPSQTRDEAKTRMAAREQAAIEAVIHVGKALYAWRESVRTADPYEKVRLLTAAGTQFGADYLTGKTMISAIRAGKYPTRSASFRMRGSSSIKQLPLKNYQKTKMLPHLTTQSANTHPLKYKIKPANSNLVAPKKWNPTRKQRNKKTDTMLAKARSEYGMPIPPELNSWLKKPKKYQAELEQFFKDGTVTRPTAAKAIAKQLKKQTPIEPDASVRELAQELKAFGVKEASFKERVTVGASGIEVKPVTVKARSNVAVADCKVHESSQSILELLPDNASGTSVIQVPAYFTEGGLYRVPRPANLPKVDMHGVQRIVQSAKCPNHLELTAVWQLSSPHFNPKEYGVKDPVSGEIVNGFFITSESDKKIENAKKVLAHLSHAPRGSFERFAWDLLKVGIKSDDKFGLRVVFFASKSSLSLKPKTVAPEAQALKDESIATGCFNGYRLPTQPEKIHGDIYINCAADPYYGYDKDTEILTRLLHEIGEAISAGVMQDVVRLPFDDTTFCQKVYDAFVQDYEAALHKYTTALTENPAIQLAEQQTRKDGIQWPAPDLMNGCGQFHSRDKEVFNAMFNRLAECVQANIEDVRFAEILEQRSHFKQTIEDHGWEANFKQGTLLRELMLTARVATEETFGEIQLKPTFEQRLVKEAFADWFQVCARFGGEVGLSHFPRLHQLFSQAMAPAASHLGLSDKALDRFKRYDFSKSALHRSIAVPEEEAKAYQGLRVAHGTVANRVDGIRFEIGSESSGYAGAGHVYLVLEQDMDLANDFAHKPLKLDGHGEVPENADEGMIMVGKLNPHKKLRIARIKINSWIAEPDIETGTFPLHWETDTELQAFMHAYFDIVELCGYQKIAPSCTADRVLLVHESAGQDGILWETGCQFVHYTKAQASEGYPVVAQFARSKPDVQQDLYTSGVNALVTSAVSDRLDDIAKMPRSQGAASIFAPLKGRVSHRRTGVLCFEGKPTTKLLSELDLEYLAFEDKSFRTALRESVSSLDQTLSISVPVYMGELAKKFGMPDYVDVPISLTAAVTFDFHNGLFRQNPILAQNPEVAKKASQVLHYLQREKSEVRALFKLLAPKTGVNETHRLSIVCLDSEHVMKLSKSGQTEDVSQHIGMVRTTVATTRFETKTNAEILLAFGKDWQQEMPLIMLHELWHAAWLRLLKDKNCVPVLGVDEQTNMLKKFVRIYRRVKSALPGYSTINQLIIHTFFEPIQDRVLLLEKHYYAEQDQFSDGFTPPETLLAEIAAQWGMIYSFFGEAKARVCLQEVHDALLVTYHGLRQRYLPQFDWDRIKDRTFKPTTRHGTLFYQLRASDKVDPISSGDCYAEVLTIQEDWLERLSSEERVLAEQYILGTPSLFPNATLTVSSKLCGIEQTVLQDAHVKRIGSGNHFIVSDETQTAPILCTHGIATCIAVLMVGTDKNGLHCGVLAHIDAQGFNYYNARGALINSGYGAELCKQMAECFDDSKEVSVYIYGGEDNIYDAVCVLRQLHPLLNQYPNMKIKAADVCFKPHTAMLAYDTKHQKIYVNPVLTSELETDKLASADRIKPTRIDLISQGVTFPSHGCPIKKVG